MPYLSRASVHLAGEQPPIEDKGPLQGVSLDSFAGPVHVEWDTEAALTPLGQLPFFIDFLKGGGLFDAFVADCPLHYTSPNAPKKRDVLGTAMLSILSGHKRYAHIAALRCDNVLPELLGMNKIVSEDAVRRAFAAVAALPGVRPLPLRRETFDHALDIGGQSQLEQIGQAALFRFTHDRLVAEPTVATQQSRPQIARLRELAKTAEQLTGLQRWRRILARAFQVFLQGRQLRSPSRLAPS